ncbi:type III-B CRISPR module RAMP protein Cmr4 [Venenivibrio stagnispumantis]|uniref:CRISPR-associated protein Cmr4 n=1 Tax=Venenivibrio stagnispumantis TaxID=407998 RepID=A0AA45WNR5_9AQUI|nr:type III-B CRISPR module RAMP protein Cmr4 [Venenivibrio stagnispumantis]MCW4573976.1 type III-B CRISPR module RAMP protein Cmr4 [Venenivibrio stagnispumantis]SMP19242.1 CRISPR-associated protein Cmr4 [Venenivibrio stagnispumantis]
MDKNAVFYHCHTPLHVGSGTTLDIIDLPIQREAHTDFPVIPSSSIKGVIRADYGKTIFGNVEIPDKPSDNLTPEQKEFFEIFGYGEQEGDVIFTDAKILFFPVKSVRGIFAWITCPMVIERYKRDTGKGLDLNIELKDEETIAGEEIVINNQFLVLEEISFTQKSNEQDKIEKLYNALPENLKKEIEKEKIAIISDDRFRYFVKNHTEVNARIRIDQTKGTVSDKALWYEELVPAETIFYNLIFSRTGNEKRLGKITSFIEDKIFQFGGDETLGRGFTKLHIGG